MSQTSQMGGMRVATDRVNQSQAELASRLLPPCYLMRVVEGNDRAASHQRSRGGA
jgi:hypothetical protein